MSKQKNEERWRDLKRKVEDHKQEADPNTIISQFKNAVSAKERYLSPKAQAGRQNDFAEEKNEGAGVIMTAEELVGHKVNVGTDMYEFDVYCGLP